MGGVLAVLVAGMVFTTRAWAREAELAQLQTDFVSNVSHELKTPLALIRMFGETLESGRVVDPAKRQEFYGIIRRESERLTHLINNVLDTAKIESGTKRLTLERGDLVSLVREALDAYAPLFARLNFDVATTLPDAPLPVSMDRDAVAQALVNLFQNAIRYSGDARHVAVAVSARDAEVVVSVADRGVGIADDDLPRIFDKFYRSHAAGVVDTAGSGLGLSIVNYVMKAHGGRVEVESAAGRGSVFTLVFPGVVPGVCRALRKTQPGLPIVMLTAKGREDDVVLGLKLGADDYVKKPFGVAELVARIETVLRRSAATNGRPERVAFGSVVVDFVRHEASRDGAPLDFTPKEFEMLQYFAAHRGTVVSRDALLDAVWGYASTPNTRTVDTHIVKLRQKVEDDPREPRYLITMHGMGYKFVG